MIVGFFADHETFRDVMRRLHRLLIGDDASPEARCGPPMLIAAISGAVMHPFVVDLDDDMLRVQLLPSRSTLPRPAELRMSCVRTWSARLLQVDVQMADLAGRVELEDGHRVDHVDVAASEVPLFDLEVDETVQLGDPPHRGLERVGCRRPLA